MSAKQAHKGLYRNWVSYFGGVLVAIGVVLVLLAIVMEYSLKPPGPYFRIFTYLLFPGVIAMGLAVGGVGMILESRRRKRVGALEAAPFPAIDLNDPAQRRRAAIILSIGAGLTVIFMSVGYNGFLLTESPAFCGKTCHTPMEPEATAYELGAHARVPCVSCHVGEGASHYVKSKVAGMEQLWGVLTNSYERPIPTPVKGLRPARETCEQCHWPAKFWGSQLYQRAHFRYDEKNTPEQLTLLIKTGGGGGGYDTGIHWHMLVENKVEYAAEDDHLQEIPWVKVTRPNGATTEYFRVEKKVEPAALSAMKHRTMDCMDCHNRPAHGFETPDVLVDRALSTGAIAWTLPFAKTLAVETLSKEYPSRPVAHDKMKQAILSYYQEKYPEVADARSVDIDKFVQALTAIYDRSVFPDMHVSWKTYPSNIGHRNSAGCFRCHDGKHVSPDGKVLTHECKACHTMPQRGPQSGMGEALVAAEKDWHPWQIPAKHLAIAKHSEILCHECHLAGRKPKTECNDCHDH